MVMMKFLYLVTINLQQFSCTVPVVSHPGFQCTWLQLQYQAHTIYIHTAARHCTNISLPYPVVLIKQQWGAYSLVSLPHGELRTCGHHNLAS